MTQKSAARTLDDHAARMAADLQRMAGEPVALCVIAWSADGHYQRWSNVEPIPCARVLRSIADDITSKAMDKAEVAP